MQMRTERNTRRETREETDSRKRGCLIHPFKHSTESVVCLSTRVRDRKDPSHTHPYWELIQIHLSHVLPRPAAPPSGMATLSSPLTQQPAGVLGWPRVLEPSDAL